MLKSTIEIEDMFDIDNGLTQDEDEEPFACSSEDDKTYVPDFETQKKKKKVKAVVKKKKKKASKKNAETQEIELQETGNGEAISSSGDSQPTESSSTFKSRSARFGSQDKIQLAGLVGIEEAIWNTQAKLHSNLHAVNAAWNKVAKGMNRPGKHFLCISFVGLSACTSYLFLLLLQLLSAKRHGRI